MKFQWNIFLAALGLALILESLPYFISPEAVKRMAARLPEVPGRILRTLGFLGMAAGLVLVALSRWFT